MSSRTRLLIPTCAARTLPLLELPLPLLLSSYFCSFRFWSRRNRRVRPSVASHDNGQRWHTQEKSAAGCGRSSAARASRSPPPPWSWPASVSVGQSGPETWPRAIDCCSSRHHERSRHCLRRWAASEGGPLASITESPQKKVTLSVDSCGGCGGCGADEM